MSTAEDLTPRFRMLVEELGRRLDHRRGWKTRVAEQLGIYPPEIPKILNGTRRIGWAVAAKVCARIGLDPRFFSGEGSAEGWLRLQANAADPLRAHMPAKNAAELRIAATRVAQMLTDPTASPANTMQAARELALEVEHSRAVIAVRTLEHVEKGTPEEARVAAQLVEALLLPEYKADDLEVLNRKRLRDLGTDPAVLALEAFQGARIMYFLNAIDAVTRLRERLLEAGEPIRPHIVQSITDAILVGPMRVEEDANETTSDDDDTPEETAEERAFFEAAAARAREEKAALVKASRARKRTKSR